MGLLDRGTKDAVITAPLLIGTTYRRITSMMLSAWGHHGKLLR